jgi:hypothetical protein
VTDNRPAVTRVEQWVSIGATVIAPTTVLGAMLFYFGYVASRSQYAYFGIDVDTIGLSTQDYIMRSPQALLVPLLVLTLSTTGLLLLDTTVRERIASAAGETAAEANPADPGTRPLSRIERIQQIAQLSRACGLVVLAVGVILLFVYPLAGSWALYPLLTPALIAFGAALTAYASRAQHGARQPAAATAKDGAQPGPAPSDGSVTARWTARILACSVIAASLFWVTATIAQWSGLGLAKYDAQHFGSLPAVILDTRERLFLRDPDGIEETVLPPWKGQTFRYRYRGLRLLIQGQNRMFLVPAEWSASDSTLVVPLDGSVRVQFQFQNQPP